MRRGAAILFFCATALAQPAKWPATLEADVKSQSWAAAERVGEALAEEIDAGRMFATFDEVAEEAKARQLYAEALEHNGKSREAAMQRCLAREVASPICAAQAAVERQRRIAHLKAQILATQVKIPSELPRGRVAIVVFSAAWCAPCVKELDELRRFKNPAATIVVLDIDKMPSKEKASLLPLDSLLGPEVPRIYVVDRDGNIRFRILGFDADPFFLEKLGWMVEAIG